MADFSHFDRYCEEHDIKPGEEPAAFAAWLNSETGWDGKVTPICTCPTTRTCAVHPEEKM